MITIPPIIWNLIAVSAQTAFSRALLLAERGATEQEIKDHIADMESQNDAANVELDRLRKAHP